VRLDAARDVNLIASQDTQQTSCKNSSSGSGSGISASRDKLSSDYDSVQK